MGANCLQALGVQVEGYSYRLRRRRWRVWGLKPRSGEGVCPDGYEDEVDDSEYRTGRRFNVSIWNVIEKEFCEPGLERKLRKSPAQK